MKSPNPYRRKPEETEYQHAMRLISCPLIGPEDAEVIAHIADADAAFLKIIRSELIKDGWDLPSRKQVVKP